MFVLLQRANLFSDLIPLIAALLGAIIGGALTFVSSYVIQRRREKKRKRRLRKAFVGELRLSSIEVPLRHVRDLNEEHQKLEGNKSWGTISKRIEDINTEMGVHLSEEIYQGNQSRIGMFDLDQIEDLLLYYHILHRANEAHQNLRSSYDDGKPVDERAFDKYARALHATLRDLKGQKEELLGALNAAEFDDEDVYDINSESHR